MKAGIIGYGKIGKLRKKVMEELDLCQVTALSDPNQSLNEKEQKTLFLTTDYKELLKQDIDIVIIATPNNITSQAVIDSLAAGKHVFCEKPPGRNLKEVLAIKEEYIKHPELKLMFGFNHRYHASVLSAHKIVNSGRMGKLMWARGLYGKSGGSGFEEEWRSDKSIAGGGILLDQGIHMIDLLNLFFGGFTEVKSFVSNLYWKIPVEDNAFILLKNNNNQYASFHSSSTQWKHIFRLELYLTEGSITISGFLTGSRSYGRETMIIARRQFEDEIEVVGNPPEEQTYFDNDRSWEIELEYFFDSINNNTAIEKSSLQNAIDAMKIVEKVYQSDESWNNQI